MLDLLRAICLRYAVQLMQDRRKVKFLRDSICESPTYGGIRAMQGATMCMQLT